MSFTINWLSLVKRLISALTILPQILFFPSFSFVTLLSKKLHWNSAHWKCWNAKQKRYEEDKLPIGFHFKRNHIIFFSFFIVSLSSHTHNRIQFVHYKSSMTWQTMLKNVALARSNIALTSLLLKRQSAQIILCMWMHVYIKLQLVWLCQWHGIFPMWNENVIAVFATRLPVFACLVWFIYLDCSLLCLIVCVCGCVFSIWVLVNIFKEHTMYGNYAQRMLICAGVSAIIHLAKNYIQCENFHEIQYQVIILNNI